MNDRELEELLRKTRHSDNSEDVQLRILSRFAELNVSRRSDWKIFGWKGIALAGWAVAGSAVLAATVVTHKARTESHDQVVKSQDESVVPESPFETPPEGLVFETDGDEPLRTLKHPWSSSVIVLTNMASEHRSTLPSGGRFHE